MAAKAVEEQDGLAVWLIVIVPIGDEIEVGRGHDPYAAEANFDSGDIVKLVVEDGSFVEPTVMIRVFKDEDAVVSLVGVIWIAVGLGDPKATAIIDTEPDGLFDVRFSGEEGDVEARRDLHCARGVQWGEGIVDDRLLGSGSRPGCGQEQKCGQISHGYCAEFSHMGGWGTGRLGQETERELQRVVRLMSS